MNILRNKLTKYNYLLIVIKIIIIAMFIMVTFRGLKEAYFYWDLSGGKEIGNLSYLEFGYIFSHFRPIMIMLLPMIGIFLNRKIGWIMILSYCYFIIIRAIYLTIFNYYEDGFILMYLTIGIIVFIPLILILNLAKISNDIYGIRKSELIKNNIIATIIGLIIIFIII